MRARILRATLLASTFVSASAFAGDADRDEAYFYKGYDYGTQAAYGPVWVLMNRGFDVLQVQARQLSPFKQAWLANGSNVGRNVLNPIPSITQEGWGKWLREEIFPLSYTADSARWVPNYGLHLIGGGQTYRELREWFAAHDAPGIAPTVFSIATLFSAAFINESLENKGVVGRNTDAIADLLVFDIAGALLFSIDGVAEFFSKTVIVSDWSLQPSFTLPRGELYNVGNYYAAKWALPFYPRLSLFGYMGFSSLGGLSYRIGKSHSISAAAGGKIDTFENSSTSEVLNVVTVRPAGALFLDRNESLLASIEVGNVREDFVHFNVYPNLLPGLHPDFGLWGVVGQDGRWVLGVSLRRFFGLGTGAGTFTVR